MEAIEIVPAGEQRGSRKVWGRLGQAGCCFKARGDCGCLLNGNIEAGEDQGQDGKWIGHPWSPRRRPANTVQMITEPQVQAGADGSWDQLSVKGGCRRCRES